MAQVYLGLGSNLGGKKANLNQAVSLLSQQVGQVLDQSSFFASKAWGFTSDNDFFNTVILIETDLEPFDLLRETQKIEREMGRYEKTKQGYSDRIIDIDILFYDDLILNSEELRIPHPLATTRDFVLFPMSEIAPDFIHPIEGKTITELKEIIN